jgi:hypothetical protein
LKKKGDFMKTKLIRMSVFAVVTAAAAYAQNPEGVRMKGTIPFDFVVGNRTMPAGQYTVERAPESPVLILKSAGGQVQSIITDGVQSLAVPTIGELVFHTYGKEYFLAEVWTPGSNSGRQLHRNSRERELAARRTILAGTTTVALAQLRP